MQEYYQFLSSIDTKYLFNYAQSRQETPTGWSSLKAYLQAKLAWNVNYDSDKLTDNFFNAMYGDAAQDMLAFFNSYRMNSANNLSKGYTDLSSIFGNSCNATYWPLDLINQWLEYIDEAIDDIEYLKYSNTEVYQMYYDNIVIERVSLYYMIIELYSISFSASDYNEIVNTFIEDVQRLNITYVNESITMATYISSLQK
jgi:hypothetical protein